MSGKIPVEEIDEAVRRVLRVKFALGLFERPYVDESREASAMLQPASLELAQNAAERSMVLLKNAPGPNAAPLLPLSKDDRTIALIGPLADDSSSMLGAWQGLADSKDVASFLRLSQNR